MNFTLRVIKNNKTIQRVKTHSIRRFTNRLRTINWQNRPLKVYLRVSYGRKKCAQGCICTFYNDGWYYNKKDLLWAFDAFTEED